MPFNSPNQFVPQTGQKIDSQQMDANFAYHDASLGALESQIFGAGGSADAVTTQKTFTVWPLCVDTSAVPASAMITRAVLDVVCPIGSVIVLPVLKLPTALYGFEYKWLNGQELDQLTYLPLWTYLTSGVSPALQGVAVVPASSPVRFTLPDWTGCLPMGANSFAGLGANRINGARADMANIGTPGALVGAQGFTIIPNQLPTGTIVKSSSGAYSMVPFSPATGFPAYESTPQVPILYSPFSRVVYYAMRVK